MEITSKVEHITPEMAVEYLKKNTQNYRGQAMSRAKVRQYAEEIKAGRWELNGEGIMFDENGLLKNGQHRLAAIALAGVPVDVLVIRGISRDVNVYDLGYNRTVSQMVNAKGLNVNSVMQCAVNLLYFIRTGRNGTRTELVQYIEKHCDELNRAWRCMLNGDATRKIRRASMGLAAYMMLATNKIPFYEVELFFRIMATGSIQGTEGYEPSSALIAKKTFDDRWSVSGNQRQQREQLDILIRAMTDFHNGKKREKNYQITMPFAFEPILKLMEGV